MSSSRSRNGHAAATASPLINGTSSKMIDHRSYRQGPEAASSDQGGIIYHNDPGMMFSRGGSSSRTKPTTLSTSSSASSSPSLSLARDGSHPAIGLRENTRPEQHQPSRGNLVKQMVDNLYVNASSKSPVPSLSTTGSRASFRNGHTTTPMSPSTGQRSFISNFKTQLSEPGVSSTGQHPAYDNLSPTSSKGRTTFDSPSLDRKSITRASLPLGYHGYQRSGSGLSTASSSTASGQTYGQINQQGGSGKGGGHSSKKYLDGDPIDPSASPTPTMTWVEILEPRSRHRMFANLNTGECRWEEPKGVPILRANNPNITQWWELYDPKTGRFYYYSSRDFKTIWQKPTSPDAVVVPLAKLQILKQNTAHHAHPHGSHLNESFDSGTAGNSSSGHVTPSSPSLSSPSHPFGSRLKAWSNGGAPFGPIASPVAPVLVDAGTQTQAPMTTKPTMISRWTQTVNVTPTHSRSNHRPGSRRPLPNPGPQPTQPSLHHYLLSEKRFAKGRYSMGVPPGAQPHPVSDGIYDPVYGSNSTGLVYGNASDFYDLVAADPVPNYQALGGGPRGPRSHQDYYDDVYEEEYYDEDDFYEDEDDLEDEESDGSYCDADDEFGEAEEDEDEESVDTEEDSEDEECDFDESESEVDQVDGQRHRVVHVQQQQGPPPPYQHHQDLGAGQFVRGHSTRQPLQVATRASVKMASVKVPQTDTKVANGGGGGGGGPEGLRMSASFSAVDFKRNALGRSSYTPSLHQYQQQQQSGNAHAAPPTTTAAQSYSNPFNSGSLRSSTGRITSQAAAPASAAQRSSTSSNIADRIQLFNQKSGPTGGGPPGGQSSPSPVIIHRTPSSPPGVQQTSTPISRESSARHSSDASSGHLQRYFDRSPQSQAPAPASTQAPPSKSHSLSQIAPTTSPNVATSPNDTNVAKLAGSLASNLSVSNTSDTYYALPPSSSSEALSNASGTPQLTKRNFPQAKVNSASPGLEASSSLETTRSSSGRNLTNTFGHSLSVDRPSGPSTLTTSPSGPIQISSNRTSGSSHFLGSFNDSHMVMLNKSQSVVVGGAPSNTKTPKKAKEAKEQAVKSAAKGSNNKKGSKKGSTKENKKPSSGSPKKDGPPNTSIESFAKECVARHRKGGIFSKKKTLKSMLTHTKKPLKRPMISTISDSTLVKESVSCFKMIQIFMRDRAASPVPHPEHEDPNAHPRPPPAQLTDEQLLVRLISVCVQLVPLRDEVLVQVARQVTANPSTESEQRGLELMCVLFWYFTASNKLAAHLHAFLSGHRNPFTAVVRRKFEQQMYRARHTHSVLFFRKPHSPEEVGRVLRCVRAQHSGLFGETLTDAVLPDGGHLEPASKKQLPWPVVLLTEALLEPRHEDREGVFRCVGDMDDVHKLKMKIDTTLPTDPHFTELIGRGGGSSSSVGKLSDVHDLHVIASTLKLYFRELREAVIPAELYLEALDSAHSPPRACALLDRLPPVNRATLCYLIRFLQVFSAPDHVRDTKMDDANLSMVWAPNILRSLNPNSIATPGPGPNGALLALTTANSANIYEQTRAEMSLVRTLIQHLDTNNAMVQ